MRRDGPGTTVTLEEGAVEVASPAAAGARRLEPGQQLRLEERREAVLSHVDPDQPVDWRQGSIVFHDLPLSGACAMLSRHGAGLIVIPGAVLTEDLIARVCRQPVCVLTHPRRGCPVVLID